MKVQEDGLTDNTRGAALPPLEISPPKRFKRSPYDTEPPHTIGEYTMLELLIAIAIVIVISTIFFSIIDEHIWIFFIDIPLIAVAIFLVHFI